MIGEVVGKCRLESIIGSGAMGEVYRAQHTTLKIPVAVKLIKSEFATDAELVARFHREARLAARLKHPNVVRVFDVGRENGINFIVMELLSGPTFEEMLGRHGPLDAKTFFALFHPLASGLAEAHKLGIVHRDIKPSNVVIVDRKKPVLTDFGIAGALAQDSRLTAPGHLLGTPAYMSPEQARGDASFDSRTDIFAMGVMMIEALTGRLPQYTENMLELINRRVSEDMPPVATLNANIAPEIARVVDT
ncbi:MAG: serine/threonine protein kinase, partial [Deltaproteobacteria bacterium]|nr:serine/threonine protein kinase [Deltaproteobacteria bacterium]